MVKLKIMLSGGFDPLHVGHVSMIKHAADIGDVIIALNSDDWLLRKKGYIFMPFNDRKTILNALRYVHAVVAVDDKDDTVCEAIKKYRPDIFGNGGDRQRNNTPEVTLCKKLEIQTIFNLGDKKIRSSSQLVKEAHDAYRLPTQNLGKLDKITGSG